MKSTRLISKQTTANLLLEIADTIYQDTLYQLNQYGGNETDFHFAACEYVETESQDFKDQLFIALKENFTTI